jgi:hypothetical protein
MRWLSRIDRSGGLREGSVMRRNSLPSVIAALLADDLVYQLVKTVFDNQPRLVKAASAASETLPQNVVKDTFLSFHPGAVRYYREIGISIPDALAATK